MSDESILARLQTEMVRCMKEKDAETLSTLRMLKTALMAAKTAKPRDAALTPEEEIEVLQRYVKNRRESIEVNAKVGRGELNAAEEREIAVTRRFLPEPISEAELQAIVQAAVVATGAAGPKDMGKVIGAVMAQVKGRAEGGAVSKLVNDLLESQLAALREIERRKHVSRAELIRQAVAQFVLLHAQTEDAFGAWKRPGRRPIDGVALQKKLRAEWQG